MKIIKITDSKLTKQDKQVFETLKNIHKKTKSDAIPSFMAFLPSPVRYSKFLKPFDKVLYTEISALTNLYGFCYASNNYFASLYNVSVDTIKRSLANLKAHKFIYIKQYQDTENNFPYRCIFLGGFDFTAIQEHTPNITNQDLKETFASDTADELTRLFCMAVYGKETPPNKK